MGMIKINKKNLHQKLLNNAASEIDKSVKSSGQDALNSVKSEIYAIRNAIEIVSNVISLNNQTNLYRRKLKRKTAEPEKIAESKTAPNLPQSPKKQKMRRGVLMN